MPESASLHEAHEQSKKDPKPKISYKSFIIGAAMTFIAQPFEVLRTSSIFLNHWGTKPSEILSLSKFIYGHEGVRGFFRGGTIGALKSSLGFGIFFNGIQNLPSILHTQTKGPEHYIYNNIVNFINGSSAMFFTTMTSTPLTVLKTRFEVIGQTEYQSIAQAVKRVYSEEGLRGFYRGILPTLLRDLPWSGAQYSIYQSMIGIYEYFLQKKANQNTPFILFAGATSSASSIMIFYPFDNIRVRYQGVRGQILPILKIIPHIFATEGITGFYRGYLPRLLKKAAQGAIVWTIYEYLKKESENKQES